MEGKYVELEVRVHGKPVREFHHLGKLWIEGRKGSDYSLRVRNRCDRRILAVISVDGLSIMDGKTASRDDSGYVLDPHDYMDIPGWRLNDDAVAKFFFSGAGGAYAAQMDKPRNIGVIGCAIFREKVRPAVTITYSNLMKGRGGGPGAQSLRSTSLGDLHLGASDDLGAQNISLDVSRGGVDTTCGVASAAPESTFFSSSEALSQPSEVGTGFGHETGHQVVHVNFEKASSKPDEVLEIRYDSRQGLKKRGVPIGKRKHVVADPPQGPDPFPADKGCKPPPGWQG